MANAREVNEQPASGGVADAARESIEDLKDELERLRAKLRENEAQLEAELRSAGERFSEGARTFGAAAAEQIRQHPLAAFGIAFAAGVLVSRLLRSR
ncbi:MAG: hypothetical protein GXC76_11340 [Rhodanobacteraceae bacterium]|jgi:ElaB/YqjD/DUF883 family membrane-anchored ribosome-binding protein|nr:hypothetical protein [Rhodanobacteraceae bacterium]